MANRVTKKSSGGGGGLTSVAHDASLLGLGTSMSPLSVTDQGQFELASTYSGSTPLALIFVAPQSNTVSLSIDSLNNILIGPSVTLTNISLPNLTELIADLLIGANSSVVSLSLPVLQTVGTTFFISAAVADTFNFPALETIGDLLTVDGCTLLLNLLFPALTSVGSVYIHNNAQLDDHVLGSIDFSALVSVTSGNFEMTSNPSLTSLDLSSLKHMNGHQILVSNNGTLNGTFANLLISDQCDCLYLDFSLNQLSQASVDGVLASLDAAGFSGGFVDLSGGGSSGPSAAGLISKSNLEGKGWGVTVNA